MGLTAGGNNSQGAVFQTRTDIYTTAASGVIVNTYSNPLKHFSIQCVTTGTVTSWSIVVEVSLDGANFTPVITHTSAVTSRIIVYSNTITPALYFRSRCVSIATEGGNIAAIILGVA